MGDEQELSEKATRERFLAQLKARVAQDRLTVTASIQGRRYEVRAYADGALCRRTLPLKVGDRVKYVQNGTGDTVEGEIVEVTTMPNTTAAAGELGYRLQLTDAVAWKVGHPVTIAHSRVSLIWPESAIEATAFVLLHEGRRLGWKVQQGARNKWHPDSRYYGQGSERPAPGDCITLREVFSDWDEALRWCASYPAHPAEGGRPPSA